jgi:ribosomal peptide maturation radical SAM protein 1
VKDQAEFSVNPPVVLFSTPWMKAGWPCLGIAALKSYLERDGIAARCCHLQLETAARMGWAIYDGLSETWGAGEALFGALIDPGDAPRLKAYAADQLHRAGYEALADWAAGPACDELGRLVDRWIDESGALKAPVVGCSVGALQLCGALYLLRRLAERGHSGTRVVGGSGLVGDVAPVVLMRVPEVHYLVNGEGEEAFLLLVRKTLAGKTPIGPLPGVLTAEEARAGRTHSHAPPIDLSRAPDPDLTEFFASAARLGIPKTALTLSFEHSRGCEWEHRVPGTLRGCTFCGLYRTSPTFRRKPADLVVRQVQDSVNRYRSLNVAFVDAYLPEDDRDTLLDGLNDLPEDITYFSELRCDLTPSTVARLARRTRRVQLGVESFSTSILRQIGKGISAAQTVYSVRLCQEAGIPLQYNLMHHIPGIPRAEIDALVEDLPVLYGLKPPQPARFYLDRNSLVFRYPDRHGIRRDSLDSEGHDWLPAALGDSKISQVVTFSTAEDTESAWAALEQAVHEWRERWRVAHTAGIAAPLVWRGGSGWATVTDMRTETTRIYELEGTLLQVFFACADVTSSTKLMKRLDPLPEPEINAALSALVERGLVFRDGSRHVRVAIKAGRPNGGAV